MDLIPALEQPVASEATNRRKRSCRGKKHDSMHNFIGVGDPSPAECSLYDSDIINRSRVTLDQVAQVMNDGTDLGICFFNQKKVVLSLAACNLGKQ